MTVERIDILPHARSPAGSYAIIKLIGINRLDGPATFVLEPVGTGVVDADWPAGDLKPLGVRAGQQSVELLVGPEIVRSGALRPGTQFRFKMSSADADLIVAWPQLVEEAKLSPPRLGADATAAPERGLARLNMKRATPAVKDHVPTETANGTPAIASSQMPQAGSAGRTAVAKENPAKFASTSQDWPTRPAVVEQRKQSSASQGMMILPLVLGFVIVAAMMVLFVRTTTVEGPSVTLFSALHQALVAEAKPGDTETEPATVLARIFEKTDESPAGVAASDVSQRQAMERANELLASAKTHEQRLEAAFWLRKALSHSMSRPRLVWAITQLGAAFASGDKDEQPNYEAAQLLWKWAADAGDPQAACFLGKLYEQGLGVDADVRLARQHYTHAQSLGGCPGLKQAMSRVGN